MVQPRITNETLALLAAVCGGGDAGPEPLVGLVQGDLRMVLERMHIGIGDALVQQWAPSEALGVCRVSVVGPQQKHPERHREVGTIEVGRVRHGHHLLPKQRRRPDATKGRRCKDAARPMMSQSRRVDGLRLIEREVGDTSLLPCGGKDHSLAAVQADGSLNFHVTLGSRRRVGHQLAAGECADVGSGCLPIGSGEMVRYGCQVGGG
mmetsp:Transcript_36928/g.92608  ORF Transcript_36928/g.92608 Transcript_36928/m.92608 type:complete len:207 (-) Transcript_36928:78-698(-)